jgi:hypothetical protein
VTVNIGEAEVAALIAVCQPFVVEAEQVEDSGLKVVNMDGVLHHVETEIVGSDNERGGSGERSEAASILPFTGSGRMCLRRHCIYRSPGV